MNTRDVFDELIITMKNILDYHCDHGALSWIGLEKVARAESHAASQLTFKEKSIAPFGRYLVHQEERFNIQVDIFSEKYIGCPHTHDTWGALGVISGRLKVVDYQLIDNSLTTLRSSLLLPGAASTFKADSDWHSTETFELPQVVSFHIYGEAFDLANGKRFNKDVGVEKYVRGTLHDVDQCIRFFTENN